MTKTCPVCDTEIDFNEFHDAEYCPKCLEWLELNCQDKECRYCKHRPKKPPLLETGRRILNEEYKK